jgi:DNA polymerase-3 subunit epsilon
MHWALPCMASAYASPLPRSVYAVVDIETTGSRFGEDRITEVAIYQTDGERIEGEWQSLVQPGVPVPTYITALTGIDDHMLADAPRFEEIAEQIAAWTEDRILVAHNAAFDYGFLRREFERCGLLFQRKRLCTVKVARKIFPGLPSYSLGRLCDRLGIPLSDRHRAFGDAQATALLLNMLVDNDRRGVIGRSLKHGSGERNLPPNLPKARFLSVPERTGVYYLYNERGKLLYIGKARNMRARLAQHCGL